MRAYIKWGYDCSKHLVGDYSFVIWDKKRQELFCSVDHTGTNTFYYFCSPNIFAFSTLLKPLFVLREITKEFNDTWIADFLATPSVMHQLDPELTVYKDIYLLPSGTNLIVRPDSTTKRVYWKVEQQSKLFLQTDNDYVEAFREIFCEAVRCRLRSSRPVGVMMSGGLDSTSVACMAAQLLAKSGLELQAYSALPIQEYRDNLPLGSLANEKPYIEAVREHMPNIVVKYIRSEDRHSLTNTDVLLAMLEQPYKIFENLFWLDNIVSIAKTNNIGVLLSGTSGNYTISWGYSLIYLITLLSSGHFNRFFDEIRFTVSRYKHPLKSSLVLLRLALLYVVKNNFSKNINYFFSRPHKTSPVNPTFAKCTNVFERLRNYDAISLNNLSSLEIRKKQLNPSYFTHLGVITTKQSLAYGLALRDPTMDKRVIEFCLSLPDDQCVRNGKERFLIRRAMKGHLPNKVLLNETVRGKQSADWVQRIQPSWTTLFTELGNIGAKEAEQKYLDVNKIQKKLKNITYCMTIRYMTQIFKC
ncbi:hypothetical protein N752_07215 [Desulforamulus aquiferis]|nr:hypothetical protein N752_07215 [Desulforamulus aquiferis]